MQRPLHMQSSPVGSCSTLVGRLSLICVYKHEVYPCKIDARFPRRYKLTILNVQSVQLMKGRLCCMNVSFSSKSRHTLLHWVSCQKLQFRQGKTPGAQ